MIKIGVGVEEEETRERTQVAKGREARMVFCSKSQVVFVRRGRLGGVAKGKMCKNTWFYRRFCAPMFDTTSVSEGLDRRKRK